MTTNTATTKTGSASIVFEAFDDQDYTDIVRHFYTYVIARQTSALPAVAVQNDDDVGGGTFIVEVTDVLHQGSPQKLLVLSHACLALVQVDLTSGEFAYESVLRYPLILSAMQEADGTLSLVYRNEAKQLKVYAQDSGRHGKKALALIKARRAFHGRLVPDLLQLHGLSRLFGDFEIERVRTKEKGELDRFYEVPVMTAAVGLAEVTGVETAAAEAVVATADEAMTGRNQESLTFDRARAALGKSAVLVAAEVSALKVEISMEAKAKAKAKANANGNAEGMASIADKDEVAPEGRVEHMSAGKPKLAVEEKRAQSPNIVRKMSAVIAKKLASRAELDVLIMKGVHRGKLDPAEITAQNRALTSRRKLIQQHLASTITVQAGIESSRSQDGASRDNRLPQIEFENRGENVVISTCSPEPSHVPLRAGDVVLTYNGIEPEDASQIRLRPALVSIHVCEDHEARAYRKLRSAVRKKFAEDKWALARAMRRLPKPGRSVLVGAPSTLAKETTQIDEFGILLGTAEGPGGSTPVVLASWKAGERLTGCLLEINGKMCESQDAAAKLLQSLAGSQQEVFCRIAGMEELAAALEAHRKGDSEGGVNVSKLGTVVTFSENEKRIQKGECVVQ